MIHLQRPNEPAEFFSDKVRQEKQLLIDLFENTDRQKRLKFNLSILRPFKYHLAEFSSNKCAYCESPLVESINIDSFRPKSGSRDFNNQYFPDHYWWLAYEWTNLLPSCSLCSHNKRDWFPIQGSRAAIGTLYEDLSDERPLLLDPCQDWPEKHLEFNERGQAIPLTERGKVTLEILALNRPYLIEERKKAWMETQTQLSQVLISTKAKRKGQSKTSAFLDELFSEKPTLSYVAARRAAFKDWENQHPSDKELNPIMYEIEDEAITMTSNPFKEISNKAIQKSVSKIDQQLSKMKRFSIKRIEIKNFKNISDLSLEVLSPYENEQRESWLLLLGDNGVGKSSILKAVALALTGAKQREKLNVKPHDILKRGKRKGWVKVYSQESAVPIELTFDRETILGGSPEALTFILGYGSTLLLPKGNIKPEKRNDPYTKINNLFDYSVALNSVDSWLNSLKGHQFKDRVAPAIIDLLDLNDSDRLSLSKGKLTIHQFDEEYTLDDISDGYKTIIALASDIMQTLSIDQASYHSAQGIVLIDELGNHLHPRWRMRIVDSLRRTFPNLQFIVSTHEPLCLRGLTHGEVTVLVRDKANSIRALDHNVLPDHNLLRVDQLLTSDLFGLLDTMDSKTAKTYEDYYALLSKVDRSQEEEMIIQKYRRDLSDQQILGNTPQQQVYYQLIEDTYALNMQTQGFKTIESLKKETLDVVKNIIKTDLDWL